MKLNLTILFLTVVTAFAQKKGDFSFEIEANQIHYNDMGVLNRYLKDTTQYPANFYGDSYINDTLRRSVMYGLSLNFQPLNFMDLGIYGVYQSNEFEREYYNVGFNGDPYNPEYIVAIAIQTVKVTSLSTGISTNVHLNKILNFENYRSNFFNRFSLSLGLKAGVSFGVFKMGNGLKGMKYLDFSGAYNMPGNTFNNYIITHSLNWSGNTELKFGYRMIDNKLFSTVGLKVGYQFLSTPVLRDNIGRSFQFGTDKEDMKLNFSGLYYGIYLNFGK